MDKDFVKWVNRQTCPFDVVMFWTVVTILTVSGCVGCMVGK